MITNLSRARAAARLALLPLLALLVVSGCEDIPQDSFASRGGISPDPTAILEGSIVYNGPAPACRYEAGQAVEVIGNVVLTLYEYDNPPFPEGSAAGSSNLLVVLGSRLFDLADCLPDGARPDPNKRISRSVPFVWPRLTLSPELELSYQIRAFYDYDNDFNPLFSVTRLPTAGDVMGAALNDARDVNMGLLRVTLPRLFDAPNGIVRRGITLVLGNIVATERPVFRLGSERRLSADAPFTLVGDPEQPDALATLRGFRALTCNDPGSANGAACGLSIERLPRTDAAKLLASDIDVNFDDPAAYAFYLDKVDLKTIVEGNVDRAAPDTKIDTHPVLGTTLGLDWYAPMVFMTRRRTSAREVQAGIPNVRLIGSVLLDEPSPALGRAFAQGGVPIAVPPMALVEWTAANVSCRVPYVAPRTPAAVTAGQLAHCGELPTGYYDVAVYSGSSGGLPGGTAPNVMPTFQSWSVPNELGLPEQVNENVIPSQAPSAAFFVSDPNADPSRNNCEAQAGSLCAGATLPVIEPDLGRGFDSPTCLPSRCCDAIAHLCGLELCPRKTLPEEGGRGYIDGPAEVAPNANNVPVPNCVPFEMPRQCCGAGSGASSR